MSHKERMDRIKRHFAEITVEQLEVNLQRAGLKVNENEVASNSKVVLGELHKDKNQYVCHHTFDSEFFESYNSFSITVRNSDNDLGVAS